MREGYGYAARVASTPVDYRWRLQTPCEVTGSTARRVSSGRRTLAPTDRIIIRYVVERQRLTARRSARGRAIWPPGAGTGTPFGPWAGVYTGCVDVTDLNPAPTPDEVYRYFRTLPLPSSPPSSNHRHRPGRPARRLPHRRPHHPDLRPHHPQLRRPHHRHRHHLHLAHRRRHRPHHHQPRRPLARHHRHPHLPLRHLHQLAHHHLDRHLHPRRRPTHRRPRHHHHDRPRHHLHRPAGPPRPHPTPTTEGTAPRSCRRSSSAYSCMQSTSTLETISPRPAGATLTA